MVQRRCAFFFFVWVILLAPSVAPVVAEEASPPQPVTIDRPTIPADQLALLVQPLTKAELLIEADGWQGLVQDKAMEIADVDIEIRRYTAALNRIEAAKEAEDAATTAVAEAESELVKARASGDAAAVSAAEEALATATAAATETAQESAFAAQADIPDEGAREALAEQAAKLREERTLLVDNLTTVIDDLFAKTPEGDGETQAIINDYRLYISSVTGLKVDVEDTTSAWLVIKGWLTSEEGGVRWAQNIGLFVGILVVAWFVSKLLSRGLRRAVRSTNQSSKLLENALVGGVRWLVMLIGIIMALSALEVSVGPLLAVIGAASFAIAFALRDSLGNFASGLMILLFRPFDIGDVVEAGGASGKIESLNLVSTTIKTFDNKLTIVPNSRIWNDVITNASGVDTRRVDLEFGISYSDDVDRAAEILQDVVVSHPKVLKDPAPVVRMNALADSSVNFVCRPWVAADDYWDVYWDVMRAVKLRFDDEGIGIPFPQRDVHVFIKDTSGLAVQPQLASATGSPTSGAPAKQPRELDDGA